MVNHLLLKIAFTGGENMKFFIKCVLSLTLFFAVSARAVTSNYDHEGCTILLLRATSYSDLLRITKAIIAMREPDLSREEIAILIPHVMTAIADEDFNFRLDGRERIEEIFAAAGNEIRHPKGQMKIDREIHRSNREWDDYNGPY
jgi:hypothetical protein